MKKTLVINPTAKERKILRMIDPSMGFNEIFSAVFRTTKEGFSKCLASSAHVGRFTSLVDNKVVAASKYSGRELADADVAAKWLQEMALDIYKTPNWIAKYFKREMEESQSPAYGMDIPEAKIAEITDLLKDPVIDLIEIEVRQANPETVPTKHSSKKHRNENTEKKEKDDANDDASTSDATA